MPARFVILIADDMLWLDSSRLAAHFPPPLDDDGRPALTHAPGLDLAEAVWDDVLRRYTGAERKRARVYLVNGGDPA